MEWDESNAEKVYTAANGALQTFWRGHCAFDLRHCTFVPRNRDDEIVPYGSTAAT
jgi:hypothetical protein